MEAFPLHWPLGYKRATSRKKSSFKQTMDQSQRFLRDELRRLGTTDLIVSTNIPVRKDGGMYTDYMSRKIDDPGVAIYFKYKGKDVAMCCDQYATVWENTYALGKSIEAIRGMERWGVSEFLDRAFTGFLAIEGPVQMLSEQQKSWWEILGVKRDELVDNIKTLYKNKAKELHPDTPTGNGVMFMELQAAYEAAKKERNFS